jgi:hypothetical protein
MEKAFKISLNILCISLVVLMLEILSHYGNFDAVLTSSAPTVFFAKPLVLLLDVLEKPSIAISFLSSFSTLILLIYK